VRLKGIGYEIERGEYGQPEIRGYTKQYLEASSPRREQIKDHLRAEGLDGPAAAQVAAHRTRDSKELLSPDEVLRQHRELAERFGNQADRVVAEAQQRTQKVTVERDQAPELAATQGVTYARDHLFERSAVESGRSIMTAALDRSMSARLKAVDGYIEAYRQYCWPVASLNDLQLAPFHVLASEGSVHTDKPHTWHMEIIGNSAQQMSDSY